METRVETIGDGSRSAEVATIIGPNGREFTALGAVIEPDYLVAYAGSREGGIPTGDVVTWEGRRIGTYRTVSRWTVCTTRGELFWMEAVRARIDGDDREWYGRFGGFTSALLRLWPIKGSGPARSATVCDVCGTPVRGDVLCPTHRNEVMAAISGI